MAQAYWLCCGEVWKGDGPCRRCKRLDLRKEVTKSADRPEGFRFADGRPFASKHGVPVDSGWRRVPG